MGVKGEVLLHYGRSVQVFMCYLHLLLTLCWLTTITLLNCPRVDLYVNVAASSFTNFHHSRILNSFRKAPLRYEWPTIKFNVDTGTGPSTDFANLLQASVKRQV